jgi:hypothetical protein
LITFHERGDAFKLLVGLDASRLEAKRATLFVRPRKSTLLSKNIYGLFEPFFVRFYCVSICDIGFVAHFEKGRTGRSFHHVDLQSLHGREHIVHQLNTRFLEKGNFKTATKLTK